MAQLRLEKVLRKFGNVVAVNNVDLTVQDREFVVLLGPSGCGKTTTLRALAGLETLDSGNIFIGDRNVTNLPPKDRGIGMVFQSYALFPHMTVHQNIGFGLRINKVDKQEIDRRVREVAKLLHLSNMLHRHPSQLSGGQRQRVAVARSLVIEPEVLLMDEPLSNLDALLRLQMRAELKRLHHNINSTTIYVTHDQVEALSLGDRIAVMNEGEIVQYDVPIEIYDNPTSIFVASFIGNPPMNLLDGRVEQTDGDVYIQGDGFKIHVPAHLKNKVQNKDAVVVGIRPENIEVVSDGSQMDNVIQGQVGVIELLGDHKLLTVDLPNTVLRVAVPPTLPVQVNENVQLGLGHDKIRLFDAVTKLAITA